MKSRGARERAKRKHGTSEKAATQWDFGVSAKDPDAPEPRLSTESISDARAEELGRLGFVRSSRGSVLGMAARQVGIAMDDPMSTCDVPVLDPRNEWFPAWFLALWTFEAEERTLVMGVVNTEFRQKVWHVRESAYEQLILLGEFALHYPYHDDIEAVKCAIERHQA